MYEELINCLCEGAEFLELSTPNIPQNSFANMCRNAADIIEELLAFARFVAEEVVVDDDEWENNKHYAFPEIICRKLNNLGIVEKDGAFYYYESLKEDN